MGTSTSSKGGKSGSPFDPEWLSPSGNTNSDETGGNDAASKNGDPEVSPDRRFAEARTKMSAYLSGGGREALRAAAKSMVNRGMGGASRAAQTMRNAAQGAGELGQFLAVARDRSDQRVSDWVDRVKVQNLSASDLALELVKEILPETGSVDDDSLRNAAADAIGRLYELNPDVDVFALSDQHIADVVAFTIANQICNRMDLLLGQTYERLKFKPREIQMYRNDVKEYVHAQVQVVMEKLGIANLNPQRLARDILATTLKVFADE